MARTNASSMVRPVAGEKPTESQMLAGRAAPRSNHGPTEDQIRRRAFQLYEGRGRLPGHDIQDWLQAERELHRNE